MNKLLQSGLIAIAVAASRGAEAQVTAVSDLRPWVWLRGAERRASSPSSAECRGSSRSSAEHRRPSRSSAARVIRAEGPAQSPRFRD